MEKYTNALIHETSLYLLQHAHNPVNWRPWGAEAFETAQQEDKMLIISIGYAACHWCHVMERESFMDEEVAAIMNRHFICIKVDREERPDIDQLYMTAAQLINGNGGWPLNVLALPDCKPFFAGTYFPKDRWIQLLEYFIREKRTNEAALNLQAQHLAEGIADTNTIPPSQEVPEYTPKQLNEIVARLSGKVDKKYGGLNSSIKFPMPSIWKFLLEYNHIVKDETHKALVFNTLDQMASGGIYDQIGGGFSRYSTDPQWHVPHFEKMLFDNAQLISLYSFAWQTTHNSLYRSVVENTVQFVLRELYSGEGFYSSLDADSEGEEGKFYTWSKGEVARLLGDQSEFFCQYYGITASGNWEYQKNIPDRNLGKATELIEPTKEFEKEMIKCNKILLNERNKRIRPATDDKILTSWNAMMVSALIDAYKALGKQEYLLIAKKTADILLQKMISQENGYLFRNYQKGKATVNAFLDDYAFLIKSLIDLYEVSFEIHYLQKARELTETVLQDFQDQDSDLFHYNNRHFNELISQPKETGDDVIPSSNSVMAENLYLLGVLWDEKKYTDSVHKMIQTIFTAIENQPAYYINWARVFMKLVHQPYEVAIVGNDCNERLKEIQLHFLPEAIFCGSKKEENLPLLTSRYKEKETMIYVCQNRVCQQPTTSVTEALAQLHAG